MVEEAKQYLENDRVSRELTELKNRIKGRMLTMVRSYSEFGRFLDSDGQEMVKNAIQKARGIDPEEDGMSFLNDVLEQLEAGAEKLTAAMFHSPEGSLSGEGKAEDADVKKILKSALKDVKS